MTYLEKIELALEAIRPYFHADGGDVRIAGLREDLVLELELKGSCGSCPSSTMTVSAVEDAVRTAVPELKGVRIVNGLLL
jgi:Fe-S cluster biogenesis protein NfuA